MTETRGLSGQSGVSPPGRWRGWFEVLAICLLMPIGGLLGSLTGFLPFTSIASVIGPLLVASYFLYREGNSWRGIVFQSPLPLPRLLYYFGAALLGGYGVAILSNIIFRLLGFAAPDVSIFSSVLSGNLSLYLWFLIPVTWGSAAIGEELIARGFLLYRIETLAGTAPANVLQAAIFALAHAYQGLNGVISIFFLALVFGKVFMRAGRNLLPIVLAHGTIDTIGITLVYLGYADVVA